jgi:hypothetical protein
MELFEEKERVEWKAIGELRLPRERYEELQRLCAVSGYAAKEQAERLLEKVLPAAVADARFLAAEAAKASSPKHKGGRPPKAAAVNGTGA